MAEYKQYITQNQENGSVMISEDVIATIAEHALIDVDGVVKGGSEIVGKKSWGKGMRITISEDNTLSIGCNVIVRYGDSAGCHCQCSGICNWCNGFGYQC